MTENEKLYSVDPFRVGGECAFDPSALLSSEKMREAFSVIDGCIEKNDLAKKIKEGVLLGFSGGPDSVLLLFFFYNLRKTLDFKLKAVHVNHSIRGDEAKRDETFSRSLCELLDVEFESFTVDVPRIAAETGSSIELAAREERYKIFDKILESDDSLSYVATAHNSTDNLETVIFNLMRGSGLSGLCGINVSRDRIIRPMLYLSKEDVVAALKSVSAPYVTDSSNECTDYTRNYIRSEIYPLLKKLSPDPDKSVMRACSNLLDDSCYLEKNAGEAFSEFLSSGMRSATLSNLHPAILARVIVKMVKQKTDKMPESVHIRAISEHLFNGGDFSISLPGAISFVCSSGKCYIGSEEKTFSFENTVLLHDGVNEIAELGIAVVISDGEVKDFSSNVYKFSTNKKIDCAIINGSLRLRTKKEGDCYVYGGIRRKLKKLFIDKKIPREQRSSIPIVEDDTGILWIPGFPVRDYEGDKAGKFKWITFFEKT